jgi:hypothetical protein
MASNSDWDVEFHGPRVKEFRGRLKALSYSDGAAKKEAARAVFRALENLVEDFINHREAGNDGNFSLLVLYSIKGWAGDIAVGKIPEEILHCASRGRSKHGPWERRCVETATLYIQEALARGVDANPYETIAGWFAVKEPTARKWGLMSVPDTLYSRTLRGDDFEYLSGTARRFGLFYQLDGRSAAAIKRREGKKKPTGPRRRIGRRSARAPAR